jgi:hypothetical protein
LRIGAGSKKVFCARGSFYGIGAGVIFKQVAGVFGWFLAPAWNRFQHFKEAGRTEVR